MIGLIGLVAHQPLLFPSLGPTAFLQTETPDQPGARPYNVVIGHLVGLLAGFLAVWICQVAGAPSVLATHVLTTPRVCASVLAIVLTLLIGLLLQASHPPAAATTLLASLGGFPPTVRSTLTVIGRGAASRAAGRDSAPATREAADWRADLLIYFMFATGIENSYPTIGGGRVRMDEMGKFEQGFKDDKSDWFRLKDSYVREADKLERLPLVFAVTC